MTSKHAVKHAQRKTLVRLFPIVVAIAAIAALMGLALSKGASNDEASLDEKPIIEVIQEGASADATEMDDSKALADWIDRLNDEQKAELEIAYEASVASGYAGTMADWVAAEVQAHATDSGNVVVVLPDGGEFTVEKTSTQQGDQDSDAGAKDASDGKEQSDGKKEDQSSTPSQDGAESALLSVDTVVAHQGDKRVALPIRILGNPGVLGLTFSVSYDESAVKLVGAENGEAFEGLLALTHSRTYASGCLFTWDGVDIKPGQVKDGVALTLFFDVADDATGLHSVAVRGASAFDANLDSISLTSQDGSIVIE